MSAESESRRRKEEGRKGAEKRPRTLLSHVLVGRGARSLVGVESNLLKEHVNPRSRGGQWNTER